MPDQPQHAESIEPDWRVVALGIHAKYLGLHEAVSTAIGELDVEHRPEWAGGKPIGCVICSPGDGSWPCTSRLIADDLRVHIDGTSDAPA